MSTLGWRILLLVVAVGALPNPSSSPSGAHSRTKRQVNTSHLSDKDFFCGLTASENGVVDPNCKKDPTTPTTNPDAEVLRGGDGGCTCAPAVQCKDKSNTAALPSSGSILTLVNVRSGPVSTCPTPEEICCHNIDITLQPQTLPPFSPSCGRRNTEGIIHNFVGFEDRQSQFGEFPWMAAVMTREKFKSGKVEAPLYICGGSLIHKQVVLTAAHYMDKRGPGELLVRLGEWNFKETSEPVVHKEHRVQEVLLHPNYINTTLAYDVALLILEQPVELGHTIDTICLPSQNYDFRGHSCVVSGWGKDIFGAVGKFQQILKSLELPFVDHATCQQALRGTRLGHSFNLDRSFMCAGGEKGVDACEGDGGSPLICHKPGDPRKYFQAGVVAWGIGCGEANVPGVYADVSSAVPWINSILSARFSQDIRSNVNVRTG